MLFRLFCLFPCNVFNPSAAFLSPDCLFIYLQYLTVRLCLLSFLFVCHAFVACLLSDFFAYLLSAHYFLSPSVYFCQLPNLIYFISTFICGISSCSPQGPELVNVQNGGGGGTGKWGGRGICPFQVKIFPLSASRLHVCRSHLYPYTTSFLQESRDSNPTVKADIQLNLW